MFVSPRPVVVHCAPRGNFPAAGFAATRGFEIVAYVDDTGTGERSTANGVRIITFAAWRESLREIPSIVTALDPAERRVIVERITAAGGAFVTIERSSGGAISRSAKFGEGTLLGDGPLYVGSSTTIGRHVIIMTPASVAHDIVIGNFVTIHPSAAISGHVVIEQDVVIGAGVVIVNGHTGKPVRVGRGTRVELGAVVTKSMPAGLIVVGNPGRPVRPSCETHS